MIQAESSNAQINSASQKQIFLVQTGGCHSESTTNDIQFSKSITGYPNENNEDRY